MKFFSEVLKQLYDSPEALRKAEAEEAKKNAQSAQTAKTSCCAKTPSDTLFRQAVESAEKSIEASQKAYEESLDKAKEIADKATKDIQQVLSVAEKGVDEAKRIYATALQEYTKRFGAYTTTYSGNEASSKFNELLKALLSDDLF